MDFAFSDEQLAIAREIKSFAKKELNKSVLERDEDNLFDRDGWAKCAEFGILGLPIPKEYGGEGADIVTTILAMESLGNGCHDNGLVHSINSHLWGCSIPILKFGSQEQKKKYLPELCRGELIGAHAVTEPDAGSDVFSISTSAVKNKDCYIINGAKSIVSNGPIADVIIVFAATDSKKRFAGGVSGFIMEKRTPGMSIGRPLKKMGLHTSPISELFFKDCKVPEDQLLGKAGFGTSIFNETMVWERSCLFASHIGAMERILDACVAYAKSRKQFGKYIGSYQAVSHQIAEIKMNIELGRLMLYKIGWLKLQGKKTMLETAIAKLFISENLKKAALTAVQIHGAYGYMAEMGIEKELRDSVAATIYSGTSEIQRNIITKYLGL